MTGIRASQKEKDLSRLLYRKCGFGSTTVFNDSQHFIVKIQANRPWISLHESIHDSYIVHLLHCTFLSTLYGMKLNYFCDFSLCFVFHLMPIVKLSRNSYKLTIQLGGRVLPLKC